jgi:hypothetical protein
LIHRDCYDELDLEWLDERNMMPQEAIMFRTAAMAVSSREMAFRREAMSDLNRETRF